MKLLDALDYDANRDNYDNHRPTSSLSASTSSSSSSSSSSTGSSTSRTRNQQHHHRREEDIAYVVKNEGQNHFLRYVYLSFNSQTRR